MTTTAPLSSLAVDLIGLYQRWISPVKGFSCALRRWRPRRQSCSAFGRRAIERFGLVPGVRLIQRRFDRCRQASLLLDYERATKRRDRKNWRDWACASPTPACDDSSAGCELAALAAPDACDVASACCHAL
jgi:putative component of membrane protein insertase Oxa1/YidC/SpoIIIJ protein YidD